MIMYTEVAKEKKKKLKCFPSQHLLQPPAAMKIYNRVALKPASLSLFRSVAANKAHLSSVHYPFLIVGEMFIKTIA